MLSQLAQAGGHQSGSKGNFFAEFILLLLHKPLFPTLQTLLCEGKTRGKQRKLTLDLDLHKFFIVSSHHLYLFGVDASLQR